MIGRLLATVALCVFCATTMQAQAWSGWTGDFRPVTEPCNPCNYPSKEWADAEVDSATVQLDGCSFVVRYKKRVCGTDGCQELKVLSIVPVDPVPCTAFGPQNGDPPGSSSDFTNDIPSLVLGKLIVTNSMEFFPDTANRGQNGCWRIIKPRCWRMRQMPGRVPCAEDGSIPPSDAPTGWLPCDPEDCCVNVMYPFLGECDVAYTFYEPDDREYVRLHRQVSIPTEEQGSANDAALGKLASQFSDKLCSSCPPPEEPPPPPNMFAPCISRCEPDLIKKYKKLVDRFKLSRAGINEP
ncbi:MAG TPA: hypothetical protein VK147_01135 [Candidatus Didemnitutus sp.]|nr:hypothetical protein [Candidatus Didemnitutus sp.]